MAKPSAPELRCVRPGCNHLPATHPRGGPCSFGGNGPEWTDCGCPGYLLPADPLPEMVSPAQILDGCTHRKSYSKNMFDRIDITNHPPCMDCALHAVEAAREESKRTFHADPCHCATCDGWRTIVKAARETAANEEREACLSHVAAAVSVVIAQAAAVVLMVQPDRAVKAWWSRAGRGELVQREPVVTAVLNMRTAIDGCATAIRARRSP